MNSLRTRMAGIIFVFILVMLYGCDSGSSSDNSNPLTGEDTMPQEEQNWTRDSSNPLVTDNGTTVLQMSDPVVIYDDQKYRMWFGSVGSDSEYASIGYAESHDGQSWSTPMVVFTPNVLGAWDDQTVEIPSVLRDDDDPDPQKRYKMWYGGSNRDNPTLTKIGYAYSPDGVVWTRLPNIQSPHNETGLVMIPENSSPGDYAVVAEPSVIKMSDAFHMWYSSWDGNALIISKAASNDGVVWEKHDGNPVLRHTPGSWETGGLGLDGTVAQPTVIWDATASRYKMWYGSFDNTGFETYTGIGYATSIDGVSWEKTEIPVLVPSSGSPGEQIGISTGPSVLLDDGTFHLWYSGVDSAYNRVINHAISNAQN
jgi:predicted GH43/DUF377 family glycosyl hydrolase